MTQQSLFERLPSNRGVKEEVTHWRHEELSARRRLWGFNLPLVDLDWLHLNFDHSEPIALFEYTLRKYRSGTEATMIALKRLGEMSGLPAFLVFYTKQLDSFRVRGLNAEAAKRLGNQERVFSEKEYVSFLYALQGRSLPTDIESILSSPGPPPCLPASPS